MRTLSGLFTPALLCLLLSACSSSPDDAGCNEDPSTRAKSASSMSYAELFPPPDNLTGFENIYDRYSNLETLYFTVDFYFVDGSLLVNHPDHAIINPGDYNHWLVIQTGKNYKVTNGENDVRLALISKRKIDTSNILSDLPEEYRHSVREDSSEARVNTKANSDSIEDSSKKVYFANDSDAVNAKGTMTLEDVKSYLLNHPDKVLLIRGRADNTGTDVYNIGLSKRRANSVKEELVKLGIKPERVQLSWSGEFGSGKGAEYRVAELGYE